MDSCVFCRIVKGEVPSWKIDENEQAYAFLSIGPASAYHTLVIPKAHYRDIFDAPEPELREVMALIKRVAVLLRDKLGISNVQIINSSGAQAQQDVFHIHFHVVPRETGDGQDVRWTTHPEMRADFDRLLARLA